MGSRIKGITLEIGGDTTGLNKALDATEKKIYGTQAALKDVNKMLKLDPTNTELLAQKQKLLQQAIQETEGKLKTLKTASEQAAKTAGNYDAWKAAYTPVQEEIVKTNDKIDKLKKSMKAMEESGQIDTEEYKNLQAEVDESTDRLKVLKTQKKEIDDEFGKPISPEVFDSLQREIIETEKNLKDLKNTAGSSSATLAEISAKTGAFGEKATEAGKKILPVSAAIGGLGAAAIKTASDFDSSMSNVQAISGATADEMEILREKAREMGAKTKFSAEEAGDAMSYMAMAGWKTGDMLEGIEGIMNLAAASGEDLATASDIVTDALTAFGMQAEDSGALADIMAAASSNANTNVSLLGESFKYVAPLFGAMNYSAEDAATALGLMANAGIKGSQAGTALKTAIANMVSPTDSMAGVMDRYQLSLTNTDGTMKSFSEVTEMLREKMGGLSETEQAAAASTLFGKEAMAGMLSVINAAPEDYEKLTKAINNADGSSKEMADTMNDNLAGQITILKSQLQELAISIGEVLMPYIRKAVEVIQSIVDKFNGMGDAQKKIIVIIAALIFALGPLLIIIGKVSLGISAVTGAFSKLTGVGGLITKFGGIAKTVLSGIGTAAKTLFGLIMAHPVIAVITVIIGALVLLYTKCEWFRDGVNAIVSAVIGFFRNFGENAKETFSAFASAVKNGVDAVKGFFTDLWENAKAIWNSIKKIVLDTANGLKTSAVEAFRNMVSGISSVVSKIAGAVKNGFKGAIDFITSLPGKAIGWGRDFIEGLADGIKNAVSVVTDAVSGVANKISKFLHFSRPDKGPLHYYEEWMPDFMEGLSRGIDQNVYKVMNSVRKVAGIMSDGMSGGLQLMAKTGNQVVNVNNDLTVQIGNEQFDAHIVKASETGIGNKQRNETRGKGTRNVRNY